MTARRIALLGLAPSTRDLAPRKEEWDGERWTLNDGHVFEPYRECDRWFDLHPTSWYSDPKKRKPGYLDFLRQFSGPVFLQEPNPTFPTAVQYPYDVILDHFGEYMTSSISWMLALAIYEMTVEPGGGGEIHLWGVDLSGLPEYQAQRAGAEHLLGWARGAGLKVFIPDACPLLKGPLYGLLQPQSLRQRLMREALNAEFDRLRGEQTERNNSALMFSGRMQQMERVWAIAADVEGVAAQFESERTKP